MQRQAELLLDCVVCEGLQLHPKAAFFAPTLSPFIFIISQQILAKKTEIAHKTEVPNEMIDIL